MKAMIVDDEKKGRETMRQLLEKYCSGMEIVAMAENVQQAYTLAQQYQPEVVFLDIEMPDEDGFGLLQRFDVLPFEVIFVTAYDHYALKAIKHHALDYLLKPVDVDELREAVKKMEQQLGQKERADRYTSFMSTRKLSYHGRMALPVKEGIVYLTVSEIVRIESDGSYSTFFTTDGKRHVISRNLKEYEDVLPVAEFFRSHKSHILNIRRVKKFLRTDGYFAEMEDGSQVEISRRKKDEFLQLMQDA